MSPAPRKIVFNVPSLMPEDAARHPGGQPPAATAATLPAAGESVAGADFPVEGGDVEGGDVRKLATLLEVGQALAASLNLPTGLHGVLEVLERRCGVRRGAVTLIEESSGLLMVEAALGYPRGRWRRCPTR